MIERIGSIALAGARGLREFLAGRMSQWLWVTVGLVALLIFVNPELLGPIGKVLAKMTMGACLGYWIDRTAFKNARPHFPLDAAVNLVEGAGRRSHLEWIAVAYQCRRALIIAACVLGSTMGL